MPVVDAMTREVTTATLDGQLVDAWKITKTRGFRNIPVVDPEGSPLRVLNVRDVLQILWNDVQREEELWFKYVMSVGYR